MIQIEQLKTPLSHTKEMIQNKVSRLLKVEKSKFLEFHIKKRSLDARKKEHIQFVYTIQVSTLNEPAIIKECKRKHISLVTPMLYNFPEKKNIQPKVRPIIVGSGPAGLFCAYLLSENGYAPIILERGAPVEERLNDVADFWQTGKLKPNSNVQFGEGGAGTFSDGKLNTLVKDSNGRNGEVLRIFVKEGAPEEILYEQKPHIGTDILSKVVKNMRTRIIDFGGEFHFHSQVTKLLLSPSKKVEGVIINNTEVLKSSQVILAIGHSARDTFATLLQQEVPMQAKSFAVGVRIEHPQQVINIAQYGSVTDNADLPVASYKLATQLQNERGVYSFCMCPGGFVVNASSEEKRLAINGMSYQKRDGKNANSAIIVTVCPDDFSSDSPLAGIFFQQKLEEKAYQLCSGKIPVQRLEDFISKKSTTQLGAITPNTKGEYSLSNISDIFPEFIYESLVQGIQIFDKKVKGFADPDSLISGVESRTSSPVRILRDTNMESMVKGLYPCGEGAGYAGGITSAAMDGIKVAEAIAESIL